LTTLKTFSSRKVTMKKRRILFLGETYRADAITWMNGLRDFGNFEVVTWELKQSNTGANRLLRLFELIFALFTIRKIVKRFAPDMVIAERTTSYGFLAALAECHPIAIAQQGITDLWPHHSVLFYFKKMCQHFAFKRADLIHAWGSAMAMHMEKSGVDMQKVMVLPKGINLSIFTFNENADDSMIRAIVTRSLEPEYKHEVILRAFALLHKKQVPFLLTIVGSGSLLQPLTELAKQLKIDHAVVFKGRLPNQEIARLLSEANFYVSMPTTEGVSASLFEAMACGCFPIVTDLPGNRAWINQRENGILVPSGNFKLLANEISEAHERNIWRATVIKKNRAFVETAANYEVNMKKIAESYHQLIDKKQSLCAE
jgi:glycosyltransferase involved in cell wall biosynthesis